MELRCPCGRVHTLDVAPPIAAAVEWIAWRHAAGLAGLPAWTVRRLGLAGAVPARRGPRGALLVRVSDLAAWIESRRVEPHAAGDDAPPVIDLLAVAANRRSA
jgi:hypothetical protein